MYSSSTLHFIKKAAAASRFLSQNRGCSKLCSSVGGDSSLQRVSYSSPWLMLPPSFEKGGGGMSYNFYSLVQEKVISLKKKYNQQSESPNDDALFVGSSHGWLALHNRGGDRGLFLSNPITGENIKLPPLHSDDDVEKVILSRDPRNKHYLAAATLNGGRLAFCNPGWSSHWTTRIIGSLPYGDITYSTADGLVFSARNSKVDEELEAWIATDPYSDPRIYSVTKLDLPHGSDEQSWRCTTVPYIVHVEDTDQLLLVRRHVDDKYHGTVGFEVYEIDRELKRLDSSLDGLALFVGPNHSLAVRGSHFPELKPGSIYFTGCPLAVTWPHTFLDGVYGGHDIGIFDYKNKTISSCYHQYDLYSNIEELQPPPLWFTPSLLY